MHVRPACSGLRLLPQQCSSEILARQPNKHPYLYFWLSHSFPKMKANQFAAIAKTSWSSVLFLVWAGLASVPACCSWGHSESGWKFYSGKTNEGESCRQPCFMCNVNRMAVNLRDEDEDDDDAPLVKARTCLEKFGWYSGCPFAKELPRTRPEQLLQVLFHWSRKHNIAETCYETDLGRHTVACVYAFLREVVTCFMTKATDGEVLGGSDRPVAVDATVKRGPVWGRSLC